MSPCACGDPAVARGLCGRCYMRAKRGGTLADHSYIRPPDAPHAVRIGDYGDPRLPSRFWAQVQHGAGCWLWVGAIDGSGYGYIYIRGFRTKAHRHAYLAMVDEIPASLEVDHRCHTRACVNPNHLQLVDKKRNGENRAGANSNSKTGIRGVSWDADRGKWFVQAHSNGRGYPGGRYDSIVEAEAAAIALRARLFTNSLADGSASLGS